MVGNFDDETVLMMKLLLNFDDETITNCWTTDSDSLLI